MKFKDTPQNWIFVTAGFVVIISAFALGAIFVAHTILRGIM